MASLVTLGSLKTQARQKSDQENSRFVSDSELTSYVNASIKELYDALISAGEYYYITSQDISLSGNIDTYDLAADFYKLLGVDLVLDSQGNAVTLRRFEFSERNSFLYTPSFNVVGLNYLRYMLVGNRLKFVPLSTGSASVKVWYAPAFANLVNEADTFDGINGWEELVAIDVAIKMMAKEESDVSVLAAQKAVMMKRLDEMKVMRDMGSPSKIEDVSRQMPWEYWSFKNY